MVRLGRFSCRTRTLDTLWAVSDVETSNQKQHRSSSEVNVVIIGLSQSVVHQEKEMIRVWGYLLRLRA